MAIILARTIMEIRDENKNVHPFFGRQTKSQHNLSDANPITLAKNQHPDQFIAASSKGNRSVGGSRKKTGTTSPDRSAKGLNKTKRVSSTTAKGKSAELLEADPNLGRRKRQKSGSPEDESGREDELNYPGGNGSDAKYGRNDAKELTTTPAETGYDQRTVSPGLQRSIQLPKFMVLANPSVPSTSIAQGNIQTPEAAIKSCQVNISCVTSNALLDDAAGSSMNSAAIDPTGLIATKPQKTLRLNPKTGTIGSPPAKRPARLVTVTENKKKTGKVSAQSKSLAIFIKYGHDRETRSAVGQAINECLNDLRYVSLPKPPPQATPSKSMHPFFLGKVAPKLLISDCDEKIIDYVVDEAKVARLKSSMTLGEAKSYSPIKRQTQNTGNAAFQHFGNTTKIMKFPGAVEACWPCREMVHIRGLASRNPRDKMAQVAALSTQRKSKYTATEALAKDDILKVVAMKLSIDDVREALKCTNMDEFAKPERSLRVPVRRFENGFQIQRRVRRELSVQLPLITASENSSDSGDIIQGDGKKNAKVNPALLKIYKSIPASLTAFDQSQYETQSWIHKYSPNTAAEVLQCGKEALILKMWLLSLTITAVDSRTSDMARSRAVSAASRRSIVSNVEKLGKKRRKPNKLEGFVISSEEEDNEMDEISDREDNAEDSRTLMKRTVVRSGDIFAQSSRDSRKLRNAVVISGPSGCGKTAMVYGIAKELGFEVFEINPSSRRSGKEILEKVGDMTRNHLVHPSHHRVPSDQQDDDLRRISDALTADLKSGRQGTMNSFFKPTKGASSTVKSSSAKSIQRKDANDDAPEPPKAQIKQQKQSLILLEEVDVLFEEDKQFWTTVMSLIAQSKRPIIMTCNDETLLPLHTLELHAIIRVSPPPADVAIDYLLLVAAAEGHIVKRKAVQALYEARQFDLRAALTELDYWCQLGVGDRKGGLDWFYPRWPPGCDMDEHGHIIRVVSEGTYTTGMGWLGRDFIFERFDESVVKEEVLREIWDGWNIDVGNWHESLDMISLLEETSRNSRVPSLSSYEAFAESLSTSDMCACKSLATGNQILLDMGAPLVTAKARDDFIIGYELFQADTIASYDMLNKEIALWTQSQAREVLHSDNQAKFKAPSEAQISAKIASVSRRHDGSISRQDFSTAFDPIAEPERNSLLIASSLESSVFDRATSIIAIDAAPYVRSIVAHDAKLQQERARLSNLLSEGGRKGKRLRNTRSALSALEGGARNTTRPERYFRVPLNPHLVNRTGLQSWQDAVAAEMSVTETKEALSALDGPEGSSPEITDRS